MESLYFLIPVALVTLLVAVKVLFWAVKSGQYDDLDTEAHRILFDNDSVSPVSEAKEQKRDMNAGEQEKPASPKGNVDTASDNKREEP